MNAGGIERHDADSGNRRILVGLLLAYGVFWVWLAIDPWNRRDWLLENLLVLTLIPLLLLTYWPRHDIVLEILRRAANVGDGSHHLERRYVD